jgi:hypothetical protein
MREKRKLFSNLVCILALHAFTAGRFRPVTFCGQRRWWWRHGDTWRVVTVARLVCLWWDRWEGSLVHPLFQWYDNW